MILPYAQHDGSVRTVYTIFYIFYTPLCSYNFAHICQYIWRLDVSEFYVVCRAYPTVTLSISLFRISHQIGRQFIPLVLSFVHPTIFVNVYLLRKLCLWTLIVANRRVLLPESQKMRNIYKLIWILQNITYVTAPLISLMYWTAVYDGKTSSTSREPFLEGFWYSNSHL